ncbi:hypothetical protein J1TS5_27970 [Paenibacillus macerans]|nr:hypothetical protein J1TS5_27970 [Paenibacillus macerans]
MDNPELIIDEYDFYAPRREDLAWRNMFWATSTAMAKDPTPFFLMLNTGQHIECFLPWLGHVLKESSKMW